MPLFRAIVKKWSFRKTGTVETLASPKEIDVWVQAPGSLLRGSGNITPGTKLRLYMKNSCDLVHFGRKVVRNAVHNAFLNTLTMGTPSQCVSAAFQQCEWCSPRNDQCCEIKFVQQKIPMSGADPGICVGGGVSPVPSLVKTRRRNPRINNVGRDCTAVADIRFGSRLSLEQLFPLLIYYSPGKLWRSSVNRLSVLPYTCGATTRKKCEKNVQVMKKCAIKCVFTSFAFSCFLQLSKFSG